MSHVLTFGQAVTLPVVWITADYWISESQLRSMRLALVHAASGGVGLVSTELAQCVRAATHGTAGSIAKHRQACSRGGVSSLTSSRSAGTRPPPPDSLASPCPLSPAPNAPPPNAAACIVGLCTLRHSHRIHTVANSLSSDFISLSVALVARAGTFMEIGKNSTWSMQRCSSSRPDMQGEVGCIAVAVDEGCRSCPGWNRDPWWWFTVTLQLLARVPARAAPLPLQSFRFTEHAAQDALRLLQRGRNLGKVVVLVGEVVRRREAPDPEAAASLSRPPMPLREIVLLASEVQHPGRDARVDELGTLVHLDLDAGAGVAVLELNDPQRFNTMSGALGDGIRGAIEHIRGRGDVIHALALQGAGR